MRVLESEESACSVAPRPKLEDGQDDQYGTATPHAIDTN